MKSFTAATALFAGLAAALPQAPSPDTYENIDITDFTVRKTQAANQSEPESIQAIYFKLSGDDAKDLVCESSDPAYPTEVITCGDSKYRFALAPAKGDDGYEFELSLYHELGLAVGFYGVGNAPTYCRAGGNGPNDFVCTQVNEWTVVIDGM